MMSLLPIAQRIQFIAIITQLRQQMNAFKPEDTLQSLELFENQLTLNEIERCFFDSSSDEIAINLTRLLSLRWERIRHSNMCYTQQPDNLVNQLCFEIAKQIAPLASTTAEIEALELNTGPYCLLMPSLENTVDVYGNNIHSLALQEFVLSDNERVCIPLVQCLHQASDSDTGQLRQIVAIDEKYPELTPTEIERVSQHSKQACDLYEAVLSYNKQRLYGDDIAPKLAQLANALRQGGAHAAGTEDDAASEANSGIFSFYEYWNALPAQQKSTILTEEPKLNDILGRLFRPDDVDYTETRFCVELLANSLDDIIDRYNRKPTIQALHDHVLRQEELFKAELQSRHGLAINPKKTTPKHILHHIFRLPINEQKMFFIHQGHEHALMYALAHEPDTLIEFQLDEESRQYAISAQVNETNDSALIVAAKQGVTQTVKLLLSWGAKIESHNLNNSTALHWAANNGHVDAVNCLLEHGALLEAKGAGNHSALSFAVAHGKSHVVELLLKKNADINARSNDGMNALDLAIAHAPKLIEPLLIKLATLPMDEQADCLLKAPNGPYPNVLFYAATNQPLVFDILIDNILQQSNQTSIRAIFDATNEKGYTSLILAAQISAHESLRKLLLSGVNIESHDLNNSTALHWAANNGHVDAVNCLLEHGALLEAKGHNNHSALNFAVIHGKSLVVELLLKKNADINVRGDDGKNALDIAITRHPNCIKPILLQLATLSVDKQAECLLNVDGGPYDDIYSYATTEKFYLINELILNSLSDSNTNTDNITTILAEMHFDEHLKQIFTHYERMKKKSLTNANYADAALATKELLIECCRAKATLFQSDETTDTQILLFQNTCKNAIEKARPVLEKHRQWDKVFAAFLLAVLTLPISLPLYAIGFFSIKTKSTQLIDTLDKAIDKPNRPSGG